MKEVRKKINFILIVFGIIIIVLLAFLFSHFKSVKIEQNNKTVEKIITPVSQEELNNNYKKEIESISAEVFSLASNYYYKITSSTTLDNQDEADDLARSSLVDSLSEIKVRVMDMRVPEANRDIHFSFVMLLDGLKKALDNSDSKTYKEKYALLLELQKEIP